MKKSEKLNEAIGNIDDNMIDAAYKRSSAKGRRSGLFEIIGSAAAVIAIAIFAVVLSQYAKKDGNIAATTTDVGDVTSVSDYEVEAGVCKRGQIWGDYIFRYTEQDGLKKYNIHTGERSDAVPVSLADNSWAAIGNTFYFVSKDYDANRSTITAYDVVTGETNVVYETSGILNAYDAYYERILLRYMPGVRANYDYHYFWFDTKTGETEELDGRYLDGYTFSEFIDDRIVWQNMDESYKGDELGRYYSTDLKGKDFKKYNFDYYYGNHYRFALEEDENGAKHYNMYVTLANETEEKLLIADLDFPLFTENKIIYTKTVPEAERQVAYTDESGKKRMNQSGSDVYVMDPDGSNDHLLFHTDECISAMNDTINYRRWYVGKDYAAIFSEYELPERGLLERVIIFNINTGEFVVEHEAENSEKIVFMTPQEVEDVTKIHVSSLPEGYDYSFSGEEVKPITDYLVSLHPVSIDDNDGYMAGMTWVIELTYADGTVKEIYHIGNTYIHKSDGNKKYYKLTYEEASRFGSVIGSGENRTEDAEIELVNISEIREIGGYYYWESGTEDEWTSGAAGMKLKEMLRKDVIRQCLPTLLPKDYLVLGISMSGSVDNIENAHSITFDFIDNKNKVVEEQRDSEGNVVYNKNEYNRLSILLYKKEAYEGGEFITKRIDKYLIKGVLSADSIYEKYSEDESGYMFMIETDTYYVLYVYAGKEGGERDLNCKNLYEIAASAPYIKENGYTPTEITVTEPVTETDRYAGLFPDDFSFTIVWDTYGISSYDSKTGTLIKTKDTTNISKYTTTYKMSKEELSRIYNILFSRIDINSYPDEYDPYNAPDAEIRLVSKPSQTVIISVTANGRTKTVTCNDISFGSEGYDDKATAFLKAKKDIVDILTNTDEWQALPEYEVFYD